MVDVEKCLKELTLEEKISLLEGVDMGYTCPIPRLGLSKVLLADGPHGVRVVKNSGLHGDEPYTMNGETWETTALPCEAAMAATWNLPLLEKAGQMIGEECQNYGVGVLLGPGANGKRSPLGGRNFEYYSEDPYLSGKMAASFILGIQSEGVGACMKHYILNDQETRRTSVDVHADERTFREIYLKPFEIAIREAHPWAIMASYNKVGGEHICQNRRMLVDILRGQLGFDGAVISDWSAVKDKVKSHKNGLDLQMPGPSGEMQEMAEACHDGTLTEINLDLCAKHVLGLVDKVERGRKNIDIDWEQHHELAVELAEEGMVLLKNEGEILPLKENCHVAVIGELAKNPYYVGGGSSSLMPRKQESPLNCIKSKAKVRYADGYHGRKTNAKLLQEAKTAAENADVTLVFTGFQSTEGMDRQNILLPSAHIRLIHALAAVNPNLIVVTQCGSAVEYRQIEGDAKGLIHAWIAGEGCGKALANILFGATNPSGRLSESFPVSLANTPAFQYFPGCKNDVYYCEGLLTGYRYYDTREIKAQYPFGFGLSYTEFMYSNLQLSSKKLHNSETLQLSIDLTNIGTRDGKEVVQVYVQDLASSLPRPRKELKGFTKILLAPGETKTVKIDLDEDAFSYYVPHLGRFAVESGIFEIMVGTSSEDIRLREQIEFCSEDEVRTPLTFDDRFGDFLEDDRYAEYAKKILSKYKVDQGFMLYELLYGSAVRQMPEILSYAGVDMEKAGVEVENLVCRKFYQADER